MTFGSSAARRGRYNRILASRFALPPMNDKQPGFLVWLLRGLWRGIDLTRRVVLNAIFWVILILFLISLTGGGTRLEPKTVLVIAPKGAIVEQYTMDPFERALNRFGDEEQRETQLRDILKGLDYAAKDPTSSACWWCRTSSCRPDPATLREVGAALERFRKSGKEVIAYGDELEQRGYYIAAHADRVFLNPEGGVFLTGIGRYRTYLKDLFDKIGVEARLFRVGEYKSAGETYVRSDQSPEAREADLYWMGDIWQRFLADIAQQRKLDAAEIQKNVDGMVEQVMGAGGDLAQLALRQGLVDELKTRDQVRAYLIHKGAEDKKRHTFRNIALGDYLDLARAREGLERGPEVAVVVAQGEIVNGDQPAGMVGGDSTAKLIRKAREDDDIKAVVLRVNSPGGVVFASEVIRREVELTRRRASRSSCRWATWRPRAATGSR
jgi:protease-4